MFDTMTLTKVIGAVCGSLLIFLLGGWAAEAIYHVGGSGDHGDGEHAQAYSIDTGEEEGGEEMAEEEGPDFQTVFASASADDGESLFRACSACHKLDGSNGVGPYLNGVVNREIAAVDGYSYSDALAGKEGGWEPEALSAFLEAPTDWAPGTKMSYRGMSDIEDRANLIAYLQSTGS